ncbi:hypothetical protein GOX01_22020 [Gluconobacter oxydans]|nr:hypothetical protein GOX01_22020 [Gluconobacter oxydans]
MQTLCSLIDNDAGCQIFKLSINLPQKGPELWLPVAGTYNDSKMHYVGRRPITNPVYGDI